jgi:hypothetical protein
MRRAMLLLANPPVMPPEAPALRHSQPGGGEMVARPHGEVLVRAQPFEGGVAEQGSDLTQALPGTGG